MRRVLVACDSFKDALPAAEVCAAIGKGLNLGNPEFEVDIFPLGDGGEGTVEVLGHHFSGVRQWLEVKDPLFRPVRAGYFLAAGSQKAFIEMAAASGLQLLSNAERNPLQTTTFGTGQLIGHAIDAGASEIVLCIGGSATNDGGMGMAAALGYEFYDGVGNRLEAVGGNLGKVARIAAGPRSAQLSHTRVSVLCDVDNFLSGPGGAAPVFAAQKGADEAMIHELDRGLAHFGQVLKDHFGAEFDRIPGAGAAGGLGAGATAFLGAELKKGAETVLKLTNFAEHLKECDLVITGEGRIDGQTAHGKLIHGVCQAARQFAKPVIGLCGSLSTTPEEIEAIGLTSAFSILRNPTDLATAIGETRQHLILTAYNISRLMIQPLNMFIHETNTFGNLERHLIFDRRAGCGFEVVPGAGANLLRLVLGGQELVDGYQTMRDLSINRSCKSNVLIPFPNRLKRGKYLWQGESYYFPINDAYTGNALHGFRKQLEFYVAQISIEEHQATLSCIYEEHGNDMTYPFPFSCRIDFILRRPNQFTWKVKVWNEDKRAIPFGLGWHPYFRLADTINEVKLKLPACDFVGIDEYMIPTGKRYAYDEFAESKALGATVLDNCFALPDSPNHHFSYSLESSAGKLTFQQETGRGKFNYLQLFTPPTRTSIAIEPMTCNIDAFNNGDGLIVLNPKEKMEAGFQLSFESYANGKAASGQEPPA